MAHHGSKEGVTYELVDRIQPDYLMVSCASPSVHGFPHTLNQHVLRAAKLKLAKAGGTHRPEEDHLRDVFYTAQEDTDGNPLGSFAVVGSSSTDVEMWRLGDTPGELPDFDKARRWQKN